MTITAVEAADSRPVLLRREKFERGIGIGLLVGVTIWLIWNFIAGPVQFINVGLAGLRLGAIYALIALGYTMVYGIIELINFAHGEVFMIGSFVSVSIWQSLGVTDGTTTLLIVLSSLAGDEFKRLRMGDRNIAVGEPRPERARHRARMSA